MKTYDKYCEELCVNGGILKNSYCIRYLRPDYMLHKDDGPAWKWFDGDKIWYYNGKWIMDTYGDVTQEQLLDFKLRIL